MPVPCNERRLVDNEREVPASSDPIIGPTEEKREPCEFLDEIELTWAIADAEPFSVVRGCRKLVECRKLIAVIFTPPIPDQDSRSASDELPEERSFSGPGLSDDAEGFSLCAR